MNTVITATEYICPTTPTGSLTVGSKVCASAMPACCPIISPPICRPATTVATASPSVTPMSSSENRASTVNASGMDAGRREAITG